MFQWYTLFYNRRRSKRMAMKHIEITRFDKKLGREVTKKYYPVAERVKEFRKNYGGCTIETQIINIDDNSVLIMARILDEKEDKILSTGHAYNEKDFSDITRKYMVEFTETKAVGRALAFLGIGIADDIASAEEMQDVESPDATFQQITLIEELLEKSAIPDKMKEKIETELIVFTQERASKCIQYLKENLVDKKLDDQLTDKLDQEE